MQRCTSSSWTVSWCSSSDVGVGADEGICSAFCLITQSGPWCFCGWLTQLRSHQHVQDVLYVISGGWLKIFATFYENGEQACTCTVSGASKSYLFLRDRYTECRVKLLLSRRTFCVHHTTMHRLTTSFYLKPHTWGTVCVEPAMLQPNDAVSRPLRWGKTHLKSPRAHTKHTT